MWSVSLLSLLLVQTYALVWDEIALVLHQCIWHATGVYQAAVFCASELVKFLDQLHKVAKTIESVLDSHHLIGRIHCNENGLKTTDVGSAVPFDHDTVTRLCKC